jgi:hypothetical protein
MRTYTENKAIETKIARLSMDEDGILCLTINYKHALTIDDIKELIAAIIEISEEEKSIVLVRSLNYKLPSREVRDYSAGQEAANIIKAVAFIVTHPVLKIGANFFLKINKPPFPFKTFTKEKEAIEWLKKFRT